MTLVGAILPDARSISLHLDRVPCLGEEVILDAISAPDDGGDQWDDDVAGHAYVVDQVIWAAPAPGIAARVVIGLTDR